MKLRVEVVSVVTSLVFLFGLLSNPLFINASSRGKLQKQSRSTNLKSNKKNKNIRSRRVSRRGAELRRRALLARVHAIDNNLLSTSQNQIMDDDLSGEDLQIRQIAVDALGHNPGTVVVMDANNGHVLSMVNQAWAVGRPFKPCSTIKLLTSLAALSEKIVDADSPIYIGGYPVTMKDALAYSSNEYFQELGEQLGFEKIVEYARKVGFGELTGINLQGENSGYIPTPANSLRRMSSHGDGYGVTALQMAVFTSALANGGVFYKPQVLRSKQDFEKFNPVILKKLDIAENDRAKIIEGMLAAVSYGTAKHSNTSVLQVAGKTGSCICDCRSRTRLGLFTSFISPSNPNLVISVITTGSSQRGSLASVVAGNIYNGLQSIVASKVTMRPTRVEVTFPRVNSESSLR